MGIDLRMSEAFLYDSKADFETDIMNGRFIFSIIKIELIKGADWIGFTRFIQVFTHGIFDCFI